MEAARMTFQMQLIPPFRYAIVEESFYRGAYPTLKNFRFLRRLQLKTIISLTPEPQPNLDMCEFCENEDINIRHFFVEKFQEVVTLTNAQVIQILELIIIPENLPLYLHCLDGARVTGLVVMCFRKLQCWDLSTSTGEFCRFQSDRKISREESQFVEAFRGDIKVPASIPRWLWQGVRTIKHPTFRLHLLPSPLRAEERGNASSGVNDHLENSAAPFQCCSMLCDLQGDRNKRHRLVCSKSEKGLHFLGINCKSVTEKGNLQNPIMEDRNCQMEGLAYRKDKDVTSLTSGKVHSSAVFWKRASSQFTFRSNKGARIEYLKLELEALSLEGLDLLHRKWKWKLQMPLLPKLSNSSLCILNNASSHKDDRALVVFGGSLYLLGLDTWADTWPKSRKQ